MSKVHPLGGKHKSASSMLAEAMADLDCKRALVFWFDDSGNMKYGHFEVTRKETAYAAAVALQIAVEEDQP